MTERLLLRQFTADDLDNYTERIFSDSDVLKYLPKSDRSPRERAQRTMDVFNEHWTQHPYGPWAVVNKANGELIGHCGLRLVTDINETELLYALAKAYWGQGLATEAARASIDFGFQQIGLKRIIALAVAENIASRRVMEHCGLTYERDAQLFGLNLVQYARKNTIE